MRVVPPLAAPESAVICAFSSSSFACSSLFSCSRAIFSSCRLRFSACSASALESALVLAAFSSEIYAFEECICKISEISTSTKAAENRIVI